MNQSEDITGGKLRGHQAHAGQCDSAPEQVDVSTAHMEPARRGAEATAIICGERRMSFRELSSRSNQLAHHLQGHGVGPDVPVGIFMGPSLEIAVAVSGVWTAGGASVLLDPSYPLSRLSYMIDDAGIHLLLTLGRLEVALPHRSVRVICLDKCWDVLSREPDDAPESRSTPDNLARVAYTSGSTGQPKGVLRTRRSGAYRGAWIREFCPYEPDEVCCLISSAGWAVNSMIEATQGSGIPTVIIPDEVARDPLRLVETLAAGRVTRISLVPSLLGALLDSVPDLQDRLPRLKLWTASGEPLSVGTCRRFRQMMPGARLLNMYASSEAGVVTCYDTSLMSDEAPTVPIGRPVPGRQIHILDEDLQPVPGGGVGELHVSGIGMAKGYLNQPELTAQRFIPNPLAHEPGECLYKTGDVGRWLPDGSAELVGRVDDQVKVRGFRVEPGEVEATLGRHPAVRESAVAAQGSAGEDKRLVAYVVPCKAAELSHRQLREFLKQRLPDHMMPSAFVTLDDLPRNAAGKVDRRALARLDSSGSPSQDGSGKPRDLLEQQLVQIWQGILDVPRVTVTDDFFELGGHSLLAVRLLTQIEGVFGMKLSPADLLEAPTVEKLADALRGEGCAERLSPIVALTAGKGKTPVFWVAAMDPIAYVHLARRLGPEQPFHVLHPLSLISQEAPSIDVKPLAARYIEELRGVQPRGPYILGGMCAGGVVAFEMAQQLHSQGQKVALLALMDTWYPSWYGQRPAHRLVARLLHHIRALSRLESGKRLGYGWSRLCSLAGKALRRFRPADGATPEDDVARIYQKLTHSAYRGSLAGYAPQPYAGQIVLFIGADTPGKGIRDARLKWRAVAEGKTEVHVVPGDHTMALREPHVRVLAEKLGKHITMAGAVRGK